VNFDAPDSSADQPYSDGVVLIQDVAAASDPCFGCDLSLTLRDVRVLRDRLTSMPDFTAAADVYAASMAGSEICGLVLAARSTHGAAARFQKIAEDPSRVPRFSPSAPKLLATRPHGATWFAED
jgi:hypothetical protein